MSNPNLFIVLKDEFAQAVRKGDFTAPVLSDLKNYLDNKNLQVGPMFLEGSAAAMFANSFYVSGTRAHDQDVIEVLKKSPAIVEVEKPAPRKLI